MGARNFTGVRRVKQGRKVRLFIDFRYTNRDGRRVRYRHVASVQMMDAAVAEAKRLMARAAETGSPLENDEDTSRNATVTVSAFYEKTFLEQYSAEFRPATLDRYKALWKQGVGEHLGTIPVADVSKQDILEYAAQLRDRGVQLKGPINFIKTLLARALDAGLIDEVPQLPRALIATTKKLPDTYTDPEVTSLVANSEGFMRTAIAMAAYAGERYGEVVSAEARDVVFDRGLLLVRRALSHDTILSPKSQKERVVPLSPELADILRAAMAGKNAADRIVVDESGGIPRRQEVLRRLHLLQKRLGLPERSFHGLRHYFCSTLVRRGASLEAVRMLAGHSDLLTTQRYVHATGEDLRSAVAKLSSPAAVAGHDGAFSSSAEEKTAERPTAPTPASGKKTDGHVPSTEAAE